MPELAVLASGLILRANRLDDPLAANELIGRSPLQTWFELNRATPALAVRIFACTDKPLGTVTVPLAGQWVFESPNQFARLRSCLERVEPHEAHAPRHWAFLRLRPDSLVLGGLPPLPLHAPDGRAVYVRWRVHTGSPIAHSQLRDSMECGVCEQWCECAQRKYGQVLFKAAGDCGVPTDRVFFFGRLALPSVMRALANYSAPDERHPARDPGVHSDHCVVAGRMIETGFGRVLEDHGLRLLPLPFRTALNRELQRDTPSWGSRACMLAWGDAPGACNASCAGGGVGGRRSGRWDGCNPVNKKTRRA